MKPKYDLNALFYLSQQGKSQPIFLLFFIPGLFNLLPWGVKPRPAGCYSGALTTRLEALSQCKAIFSR